MGLDPILDSLNLEDGQLVIAEEDIDGVLQGMDTPMSDIPVLLPFPIECRRSPISPFTISLEKAPRSSARNCSAWQSSNRTLTLAVT